MNPLFTVESNYHAMVEMAKKLGVDFVGRTKKTLANDLNAAIGDIAAKRTILKLDIEAAEKALTPEEFAIFSILYNKVADYKVMEEMMADVEQLVGKIIPLGQFLNLWGPPGIGKNPYSKS